MLRYFLSVLGLVGAFALIGLAGVNVAPAQQITSPLPYAVGTYTPSLTFGGGAVGMTYDIQTGAYTRVGDTVTAEFYIDLSAKGSSTGSATISMPFTASTAIGAYSCMIGFASGLSMVTGAVIGTVTASASAMQFYQSGGGAAGALTNSHFANTSVVIGTCVFKV